jgi:hypothetical protein
MNIKLILNEINLTIQMPISRLEFYLSNKTSLSLLSKASTHCLITDANDLVGERLTANFALHLYKTE